MPIESGEAPKPRVIISIEDQARLEESLPMLIDLRAKQEVMSETLPHDIEAFPDTPASLATAEYMSRGDPLELGVWQLTLGSVGFRLSSIPTPGGRPNFELNKLTPDPLLPEEIHDVVTVVTYLNRQWHQYTETPR